MRKTFKRAVRPVGIVAASLLALLTVVRNPNWISAAGTWAAPFLSASTPQAPAPVNLSQESMDRFVAALDRRIEQKLAQKPAATPTESGYSGGYDTGSVGSAYVGGHETTSGGNSGYGSSYGTSMPAKGVTKENSRGRRTSALAPSTLAGKRQYDDGSIGSPKYSMGTTFPPGNTPRQRAGAADGGKGFDLIPYDLSKPVSYADLSDAKYSDGATFYGTVATARQ